MRALILVVVMMGCGPARLPGAPEPGKACAAGAMGECTTSATVAYCEDGKWVEYNCPGECRNAQSPRCNWDLSMLGDACPKSFEGTAFCATSVRMFKCTNGHYAAMDCANTCTATSQAIECH